MLGCRGVYQPACLPQGFAGSQEVEEKHEGLAYTVLQFHRLYAEAAQPLMESRHLLMQLTWTPTIPNSAVMAPWVLHCLRLMSAWPPDMVTDQEGLFCRSLACWSLPAQFSGWLQG